MRSAPSAQSSGSIARSFTSLSGREERASPRGLRDREAAVHGEDGAGYAGGGLGGEEGASLGDVPGARRAPERRRPREALVADKAGSDDVDGDPVRPEFDRCDLGERRQEAAGGGGERRALHGADGGRGREEDHPPRRRPPAAGPGGGGGWV